MKVKIANPIYDVMFKYLMEDMESAKIIISAVLNKNIVSLTTNSQEHVVHIDKFDIKIYRLDFTATIENEDGTFEKILIEMQKVRKPGDIGRFRLYLGDNYAKKDYINSVHVSLPISCIYFIGYPVAITQARAKKDKTITDPDTGEVISEKLDIFELLNHESNYIFVNNLPKAVRQNVLFDILEIFDQSNINNLGEKWILELDKESTEFNEKKKHLIMRLQQATMEADLLEKARVEEIYNEEFDNYFNEQNRLREEALKEKQEALKREQEALKKEQEALKKEQEASRREQEASKREQEASKREQEASKREQEILLNFEAIQKENEELRKLLNK